MDFVSHGLGFPGNFVALEAEIAVFYLPCISLAASSVFGNPCGWNPGYPSVFSHPFIPWNSPSEPGITISIPAQIPGISNSRLYLIQQPQEFHGRSFLPLSEIGISLGNCSFQGQDSLDLFSWAFLWKQSCSGEPWELGDGSELLDNEFPLFWAGWASPEEGIPKEKGILKRIL